jgi:two-component system, LytTR family, response regulator
VIPRPTEPITVLVVDDETPARQRLIDLLRKEPLAGTILEASDGLQAIDAIERQRPGLVFLDVQMPELDGLGVIEAVGPEKMPLTVFVTAHDQHAIRAFESNALDYLLKPFSDERMEATLARVRARLTELQAGEFGQSVLHMLTTTSSRGPYLDRLVLKSVGATHFVRVAEIDWIEAAGVYVNLHVGGKALLHRAALNQLAESLDPLRFIRVHRSAIVNIDSIVRLEPVSHGEFDLILKNGSHTRVSRTYRAALEKRLGQAL